MGYDFSWNGIGKPILKKIDFIKSDGTIVAKDDDEFRIQPFIAYTERIGQLYEETVINEGYLDDLVDVEGFQVDEDFNLVLRVEFDGTNANNDISMIRITYKKYGVTQLRNIPFDTGVIMDE